MRIIDAFVAFNEAAISELAAGRSRLEQLEKSCSNHCGEPCELLTPLRRQLELLIAGYEEASAHARRLWLDMELVVAPNFDDEHAEERRELLFTIDRLYRCRTASTEPHTRIHITVTSPNHH